MTDIVGQTVGGDYSTVVIREVSGADIQMGDVLACDGDNMTTILQVYGFKNGSQLSDRTKEMLSSTTLGDGPGVVQSYEPEMRNYVLALAKQLATKSDAGLEMPKDIVESFTPVRRVVPKDLPFMDGAGRGRIRLGQMRSGSTIMPGDGLWMDATKTVSHHMLVVAPTSSGKSNFVKCMLWGMLDTGGVGMLVLDAYGEYYAGLSAHPKAHDSLRCYEASHEPERGAVSLNVSVRSVRPADLRGVVELSSKQEQAMAEMYDKHGHLWIEQLEADSRNGNGYKKGAALTRAVLYRNVKHALGLDCNNGVFVTEGGIGERAVKDITDRLDAGQVVVVDTSCLGSSEEQAVGNVLAGAVLEGRRRAEKGGGLAGLPPVGVVMEGAEGLLADADNTCSQIAREGQNFKVGVVAVTHLASQIPRGVLANLSTMVIFGNEMQKECKAITESAAQDLSRDAHNIASLNPGEAIVTSVFAPFAVPIRVPLFDDLVTISRGAGQPEQAG